MGRLLRSFQRTRFRINPSLFPSGMLLLQPQLVAPLRYSHDPTLRKYLARGRHWARERKASSQRVDVILRATVRPLLLGRHCLSAVPLRSWQVHRAASKELAFHPICRGELVSKLKVLHIMPSSCLITTVKGKLPTSVAQTLQMSAVSLLSKVRI